MRASRGWVMTLLAVVVAVSGASRAIAGPLDPPGYQKAFSCSVCHGFAGNSKTDTVPILAGMAPWYLKKAIGDYASGKRPAAEMEPYAKMITILGVDDVAAYFAAQPRQPSAITLDPAAVERGRRASAQCVMCHGPTGQGDPGKGIPDIAGQPPGYLQQQMLKFNADTRSPQDAALTALKTLVATIPDATFADLAAYYSSGSRDAATESVTRLRLLALARYALGSEPTTLTNDTHSPGAPPRLWVSASLRPRSMLAVWRLPASPRSWSQHSKSMRRPEAPMGWPKDLPAGAREWSPTDGWRPSPRRRWRRWPQVRTIPE